MCCSAGLLSSMRLLLAGTRLMWHKYHAGFGLVLLCQSILATESIIHDTRLRRKMPILVELETVSTHTHTHTPKQSRLLISMA